MKRTVMALMVILVMALGNVCFAEESSTVQTQVKPLDLTGVYKQAQDVSDMYNDCVYLYQSSGLNYERFDQMFIRATLAKNNFLARNGKSVPVDIYVALEKVDKAFADARDLWRIAIERQYIEKSSYTDGLMARYPKLKAVHRQGLFGVYDVNNFAPILGQYCVEYNEGLRKTTFIEPSKMIIIAPETTTPTATGTVQ